MYAWARLLTSRALPYLTMALSKPIILPKDPADCILVGLLKAMRLSRKAFEHKVSGIDYFRCLEDIKGQ